MTDKERMLPEISERKGGWRFTHRVEGVTHLPCDEYTEEKIEEKYRFAIIGDLDSTVGYGVRVCSREREICSAWEVFEDKDAAVSLLRDFITNFVGDRDE